MISVFGSKSGMAAMDSFGGKLAVVTGAEQAAGEPAR
jgi:hypothetical protein